MLVDVYLGKQILMSLLWVEVMKTLHMDQYLILMEIIVFLVDHLVDLLLPLPQTYVLQHLVLIHDDL
jgi:hypothetical protein